MKQPLAAFCAVLAASCTSFGIQEPRNGSNPDEVVISSTISNRNVNTITQDSDGYIWMGTFRGLNRYNGVDFHQFFCFDDNTGLSDNQVKSLHPSKDGSLWISTVNGVNRMRGGTIERIPMQESVSKQIFKVFENTDGELFFDSGYNLFRYDSQRDSLVVVSSIPDGIAMGKYIAAPDNSIWCLAGDTLLRMTADYLKAEQAFPLDFVPGFSFMEPNGNLWLSDGSRLTVFSLMARSEVPLPECISSCKPLIEGGINAICPIGSSYMLFSTEKNGFFLHYALADKVVAGSDPHFPFDLPPFSNVTDIFRDIDHNLWFASSDKGFFVSYRHNDMFNHDRYLVSELADKTVVSIDYSTKDDILAIATLGDGLFLYGMKDSNLMKFPSVSCTRILFDSDGNLMGLTEGGKYLDEWKISRSGLSRVSRRSVMYPTSVKQDGNGTTWMGCSFGWMQILKKGEKEIQSINLYESNGFTFTPGICPMPDGSVMVTSFNRKLTNVRPDKQIQPITFDKEDINRCIRRSVFIPTDILLDRDSCLWLGTVANGLHCYDLRSGKLNPVPDAPCIDISGLLEDNDGNIWVSTMDGLGKYVKSTGQFVSYFEEDGIGGNQFYDRAACKLPDGTLIFGGNHGLTMFNPDNARQEREVRVLIEDIKVHNEIMGNLIDSKGTLVLNHRQDAFSIGFAALNYSLKEQVRYSYILDGFDPQWVDARFGREAYYANVPAGDYTFRVRVYTQSGSIAPAEILLPVHIKVAPWLSWWAKLIYLILTAVLASVAIIRQRRHKAIRLEAERAERERNFFTNIAHEFRSPLTTISGPLSMLSQSESMTPADRRLVEVARRSSNWMLQLVGQFLDLGKLEKNTLKLGVEKMDVVPVIRTMVDTFSMSAGGKNIRIITEGLEEPFEMPLDADKFTKILSNLLSNAQKFTPAGGMIKVVFDTTPDGWAEISVCDNGPGVPKEFRKKIFEKYYQIEGNGKYNAGTGIGLYYALSLARSHHGELTVGDNPAGQGVMFTIRLPYTNSSYLPKEFASTPAQTIIPIEASPMVETGNNGGKPQILIVDDDQDIVNYLTILLSEQYDVRSCFDADSALVQMGVELPDIVLSDVMMPGKDGYELCADIRNNIQMSHVPVVLVTAKASVDNQVAGLEAGADAYVTKPFEPKYLLAVLKSQLEKRRRLQQTLNNETSADVVEKDELAPQDKAFLTELYGIMEEALSDPEIDINHIADRMKISRTKFFYKVKGLTGESPGAFFKNYKFNRAVALIREGKYNLSEIAYMTGFTSLSQFSTSFKKQFGVPPSEFK